ncbi:DinB family protein [Lapillicoccus jejuensis]
MPATLGPMSTDDARTDPRPFDGDERATLLGFLAGQREILRRKCAGLDADQLARTLPPSTLTLGGLLNHATLNENWWFVVRLGGGAPHPAFAEVDFDADPDFEFHEAAHLSPEELRCRYDDACAASDAVLAGIDDLSTRTVAATRDGERMSARWVLLHMVEETARHAGHADLLREAVDGATGE